MWALVYVEILDTKCKLYSIQNQKFDISKSQKSKISKKFCLDSINPSDYPSEVQLLNYWRGLNRFCQTFLNNLRLVGLVKAFKIHK